MAQWLSINQSSNTFPHKYNHSSVKSRISWILTGHSQRLLLSEIFFAPAEWTVWVLGETWELQFDLTWEVVVCVAILFMFQSFRCTSGCFNVWHHCFQVFFDSLCVCRNDSLSVTHVPWIWWHFHILSMSLWPQISMLKNTNIKYHQSWKLDQTSAFLPMDHSKPFQSSQHFIPSATWTPPHLKNKQTNKQKEKGGGGDSSLQCFKQSNIDLHVIEPAGGGRRDLLMIQQCPSLLVAPSKMAATKTDYYIIGVDQNTLKNAREVFPDHMETSGEFYISLTHKVKY